jgi:hypothetical protein
MVLLLTGLALALVVMVLLAILATHSLRKAATGLDTAVDSANRQATDAS